MRARQITTMATLWLTSPTGSRHFTVDATLSWARLPGCSISACGVLVALVSRLVRPWQNRRHQQIMCGTWIVPAFSHSESAGREFMELISSMTPQSILCATSFAGSTAVCLNRLDILKASPGRKHDERSHEYNRRVNQTRSEASRRIEHRNVVWHGPGNAQD